MPMVNKPAIMRRPAWATDIIMTPTIAAHTSWLCAMSSRINAHGREHKQVRASTFFAGGRVKGRDGQATVA